MLDSWPPSLVNVPNLDRSRKVPTIRIVEGSVDVCEKMLRQICEAHINELVLYLAAMPRAITLNLRGVLRVPCGLAALSTLKVLVMTAGFPSTDSLSTLQGNLLQRVLLTTHGCIPAVLCIRWPLHLSIWRKLHCDNAAVPPMSLAGYRPARHRHSCKLQCEPGRSLC